MRISFQLPATLGFSCATRQHVDHYAIMQPYQAEQRIVELELVCECWGSGEGGDKVGHEDINNMISICIQCT